MSTPVTPPAQPWWSFGHVWLVIAGPVVVVVAAVVTGYIAMRDPDPVLAEDYYRRGVEINKTLGADTVPAMQARNHAATGIKPDPKSEAK